MTDDELRELSVRLEQLTGYDSIPTVETHYEQGAVPQTYRCVFPGCRRGSRTAIRMWRHVHWEHTPRPFPIKFADLTPEYDPPVQ